MEEGITSIRIQRLGQRPYQVIRVAGTDVTGYNGRWVIKPGDNGWSWNHIGVY